MTNMFKKPIFLIILTVIIIGIVGAIFLVGKNKSPAYDFIVAKRLNLTQEVSSTGRVKPAETIDLAFEKGGVINFINAKVGDKVKAGQALVGLDSQELSNQLQQAEANLDIEKANLSELENGTRPEELQAAETTVTNAEKTLKDVQDNLANVKSKADGDLRSVYDGELTASQAAVTAGRIALMTLTDIQFDHFTIQNTSNSALMNAKDDAIFVLLGGYNAGWWNAEAISKSEGGAFGAVQKAFSNPTYSNIDDAVSQALAGLQKVKQALDTIPITVDLSSTDKTNISTEKNSISTEITNLSSKQQVTIVQKNTSINSINTAQTSLTTAENTLAAAKDQLALKRAGATVDQLAAQEARVKSVQASVENIKIQLFKRTLYSPINGIITRQEAKIGEIASANSTITSLISEKFFEIETNIPEADIAKVKISDTAKVTLDAYGNDVLFQAKVVSVDPSETIVEGVATYKTRLEFLSEDERIKPGMTANIDVLTDKRENVIAVPNRAIQSTNGDKLVKIVGEDGKLQEVKIRLGMRDSEGNVEITDGIKEGDKVVTFEKTK